MDQHTGSGSTLPPIVAGVDGSPASLTAAEHAAYAAVLRARPLRLVHGFLTAFDHGLPHNPYRGEPLEPDEAARRTLADLAGALRRRWPHLAVHRHHAPRGGAAALIDESQRADLVVIGSRDDTPAVERILGSVDAQIAAYAHSPVLVVRPARRPVDHPGPIVVGVDGSPAAQVALALAADEAARRSRPLVIVHCWSARAVRDARETFPGIEASAMAWAGDLVAAAAAAAHARWPGVVVTEQLIHTTDPARALAAASRDACLLVVGARPRTWLAGTLLGSVSQRLLRHAPCPVLVAR